MTMRRPFIDLDGLRETLFTLRQNKLRSALTAFGVCWGVYMIIVLVGVGNGLQSGAYESFGSLATNSVFIWTRTTTKPYQGLPRGRRFHFRNSDIQALRRNIPEIEHLAPRGRIRGAEAGGNNVVYEDRKATVTIYGDYPAIQHIRLMRIQRGRFLNQRDIREKRKVAVIGYRAEELLFDSGVDPVGRYIRVNGVSFQVVGVFRFTHPNERDEKEDAKAIFLPLTTFQQLFNWGDVVGYFSLTARSGASATAVKEKLVTMMARRHQVAPDDRRAFGHWNMETEFKKIQSLFVGIRFLIWFVGLFTLVAGVIGVSNIMLIAVKERTAEIGIKRAVGATPGDIIRQVMVETVLLTACSGYLGLVAGVGTLALVNRAMALMGVRAQMFRNPGVDLSVALLALLALMLSGALASLLPAYRAARIRPVEALRYEL
ncbi:MAG: ABC transporter permease [Desulfosarcinaceae bacterium]|nr:ABC transporter permease [Desulfosarcinaceae bacterium]